MYYVEMIEYIAKAKRMESRVIDFEDNTEAKKKYFDSLACYAWPVLCAIGLYNMSEEGVLTLMHWSALDLHRNDPAKPYLDWKDNAAGRRYPDIGQMMLYSDKHNSYEYRSTLLRVCYDLVPGWKSRENIMPKVSAARFKPPVPKPPIVEPYSIKDALVNTPISLQMAIIPSLREEGPYAVETLSYDPATHAFQSAINYAENLSLAQDIYGLLVRSACATYVCAVGLYDTSGPAPMLISWVTRHVCPDNPELMPPKKRVPLTLGNSERQDNSLSHVCWFQSGWQNAVIVRSGAETAKLYKIVFGENLYRIQPLPDKPVRLTVTSALKA